MLIFLEKFPLRPLLRDKLAGDCTNGTSDIVPRRNDRGGVCLRRGGAGKTPISAATPDSYIRNLRLILLSCTFAETINLTPCPQSYRHSALSHHGDNCLKKSSGNSRAVNLINYNYLSITVMPHFRHLLCLALLDASSSSSKQRQQSQSQVLSEATST